MSEQVKLCVRCGKPMTLLDGEWECQNLQSGNAKSWAISATTNYEKMPAIRLCSRAELDKFLAAYWPSVLQAATDYAALSARLVEAERDAGRYRWLKLGNTREHVLRVQDNRAMDIAVDKCGDDWDELIDAARAEFAAIDAAEGKA